MELEENKEKFSLGSPSFEHNELMPFDYTCDGNNASPPLEIHNTPKETQSFALIMDDPDAPSGVWDHWIKWNIPATTTLVEEGKEPVGVSGIGTAGDKRYHGPCPPSGTHRYIFKLYALDTLLSLPEGSSKEKLEEVMNKHILAEAHLTGLYKRQEEML